MNSKLTFKENCNSQQILNVQHQWFDSICGRYLQEKEQTLFDQIVFDFFGFNALQMGCLQMDLLRNSRIPNCYRSSEFATSALQSHLSCYDDFLPFADMSLDLLLLPHRLEFSERPHQTLREASRVMMPEGHLLISGFNPFSIWGFSASLNKLFFDENHFPWNGHYISLTRMKDWLALLGFEILSIEMCCHIPPFDHQDWHKRCLFMDVIGERFFKMTGGVYFIVAKKRMPGMTPIKPHWKNIPLLSPLVVSQPQSNSLQSKPIESL